MVQLGLNVGFNPVLRIRNPFRPDHDPTFSKRPDPNRGWIRLNAMFGPAKNPLFSLVLLKKSFVICESYAIFCCVKIVLSILFKKMFVI